MYDRVSTRMSVMGRGCFFFQAEDGIRDLVRSRGLGDVYKRQSEPVKSTPIFLLGIFSCVSCVSWSPDFDGGVVNLSLIHI